MLHPSIQRGAWSFHKGNSRKGRAMIDDTDRYWGGTPGRTWGDRHPIAGQFKLPLKRRHSEAPISDDRIPAHEVPESNELMRRMGLGTRYHPDGRAYLIQGS
jgi:hypothetical protein